MNHGLQVLQFLQVFFSDDSPQLTVNLGEFGYRVNVHHRANRMVQSRSAKISRHGKIGGSGLADNLGTLFLCYPYLDGFTAWTCHFPSNASSSPGMFR